MAGLSGQASGPRGPHTRYSLVIDSERGLYRQVCCPDKVIDNAGHVVFSSRSHFFGVIEEMPIYSNGTKTGTLQIESFWSRLKTEFYDRQRWPRECLFVCGRKRYNTYHPHSSLGFSPPTEYANQWNQTQEGTHTAWF